MGSCRATRDAEGEAHLDLPPGSRPLASKPMPDTIAHYRGHAGSASLADALARRLDLRRVAIPDVGPPDAVIAVAPTTERRHREPTLPVVILSRSAAAKPGLGGRSIVCGVHDESDAPAAAIAAAVARGLGLPLLLIHVRLPVTEVLPGAMVGAAVLPITVEHTAQATDMLDRLGTAAGLDDADIAERRVRYGRPGRALMATARSQDAALVVVSASARPWPRRIFGPSVTAHLVRRCDRPILVCPRDPAPALRVREALSSAPDGARLGL
jgi:nucleotide-binding universal stress UspA family protein